MVGVVAMIARAEERRERFGNSIRASVYQLDLARFDSLRCLPQCGDIPADLGGKAS
jgi:hypothetical protein